MFGRQKKLEAWELRAFSSLGEHFVFDGNDSVGIAKRSLGKECRYLAMRLIEVSLLVVHLSTWAMERRQHFGLIDG